MDSWKYPLALHGSQRVEIASEADNCMTASNDCLLGCQLTRLSLNTIAVHCILYSILIVLIWYCTYFYCNNLQYHMVQ